MRRVSLAVLLFAILSAVGCSMVELANTFLGGTSSDEATMNNISPRNRDPFPSSGD